MPDYDFGVDRKPGSWGRVLVLHEVLDGVVETVRPFEFQTVLNQSLCPVREAGSSIARKG